MKSILLKPASVFTLILFVFFASLTACQENESYVRFEGQNEDSIHFEFKSIMDDWVKTSSGTEIDHKLLELVTSNVSSYEKCRGEVVIKDVIDMGADGVLIKGLCKFSAAE